MATEDVAHVTAMMEELAAAEDSITQASYPFRLQHTTPKATRFFSTSSFSTPHKETDDPNRPARDFSYSSPSGLSGDRSPRYPGLNTSPRRSTSRAFSTKIDDHIYTRGFLEGACSDVKIKAFGKIFALHRIILDRSPFFSMMFSGPWKDSESSSMEVKFDDPNITCAAFEFALSRLYGKTGNLDNVDTLSLLATAAYLDMGELQEQCTNWQLKSLGTQNLCNVINFVMGKSTYGISSDRLREACRALLFRDGYEMSPQDWSSIPVDLVAEIVSNDAFFCPSEIDRYIFIKAILESRRDIPEDVELLGEVLRDHVYYMHMTQAELKSIRADGIVGENVLFKALWDQIELREEIADGTSPVLGVTQTEETDYQVPCDDTCYIGDPLLVPPTSGVSSGPRSYGTYPPFRFSAEFDHINDLKEDTRIYSHTVFYAGSYWNIYIHNKVRARKSRQLGVYLHRVELKPSNTNAGSLSELLAARPDGQAVISSSPPPRDAQGVSLTAIPESKRPYLDHRSTISTYFKIYCPSRRGSSKIGVTEFSSGPDEFHRSQSWGWKSRGLCAYDEKELLEGEIGSEECNGLKFMVVLGVV